MTRSLRTARLLTLALVFSSPMMLSGCSLVSPSGTQSGPAAQPVEIVTLSDYVLNGDGTLRKPHVTLSVPTMSEPAFQLNETGAEQAARHFIGLINYSQASGDTTALDKLSEERCTYCQSLSDSVTSLYKADDWFHGLKYTINQVGGNHPVSTNSPETA